MKLLSLKIKNGVVTVTSILPVQSKQDRWWLAKKLEEESRLVATSSMEILAEMEQLERVFS